MQEIIFCYVYVIIICISILLCACTYLIVFYRVSERPIARREPKTTCNLHDDDAIEHGDTSDGDTSDSTSDLELSPVHTLSDYERRGLLRTNKSLKKFLANLDLQQAKEPKGENHIRLNFRFI